MAAVASASAAAASPVAANSSRFRSVRIRPGNKLTTRTPRGPYSSAMSLATMARPGRSPLDRPSPGTGVRADVDSTSPTTPPGPSADANVRAARTVPKNTVSNAARHCSSVILAAVPRAGPPTEISAPSNRPNRRTAVSASSPGAAGSARSAAMPTAEFAPPNDEAAARTCPASRDDTTTLAPSATSACAVAKPSPREAPVRT